MGAGAEYPTAGGRRDGLGGGAAAARQDEEYGRYPDAASETGCAGS